MSRHRFEGSTFERAVARERARLGDGPYLVISQDYDLDPDGIDLFVSLVEAHAERERALAGASELFAEMCSWAPPWPEDPRGPSGHIVIVPQPEVELVVEHARRVQEVDLSAAATWVVQVLKIQPPPVVGAPLFRALAWSDDLADSLEWRPRRRRS
jgi:hypothetical protein